MKTNLKPLRFLIVFFIAIFLFNSCRSDDDNSSSSNQQTINQVNATVKVGNWKISKYIDSGTDKTTNFSGYNFTFGDNSALSATNGTNTYSGTWSVTDSNSNDDNPDDVHFNISFSSPAQFADLTDDWHIISQSSSKIELIDVSGGNGGTDYLTFVKN